MSKMKDRDKAKKMYVESNGEMPLVDIAKKLKKAPGTVRGWKSRYKWDQELGLNVAKNTATLQDNKCNVTKRDVTTSYHEDKAKRKAKSEIIKNKNLSDKQQLFCVYYLKYYNATKAYQKAYQVDYPTANAHGYKLLSNVVIAEEIERLKNERLAGIQLDAQAIMQKYLDIAFADVTDYLEWGKKEVVSKDPYSGKPIVQDGEVVTEVRNYVSFKESDEVDGSIISEVSYGKDGAKLKLHDKMKALEWLSKRTDLLTSLEKSRLEREKLQMEQIKQDLDTDLDKPIEINIVTKKNRVGDK